MTTNNETQFESDEDSIEEESLYHDPLRSRKKTDSITQINQQYEAAKKKKSKRNDAKQKENGQPTDETKSSGLSSFLSRTLSLKKFKKEDEEQDDKYKSLPPLARQPSIGKIKPLTQADRLAKEHNPKSLNRRGSLKDFILGSKKKEEEPVLNPKLQRKGSLLFGKKKTEEYDSVTDFSYYRPRSKNSNSTEVGSNTDSTNKKDGDAKQEKPKGLFRSFSRKLISESNPTENRSEAEVKPGSPGDTLRKSEVTKQSPPQDDLEEIDLVKLSVRKDSTSSGDSTPRRSKKHGERKQSNASHSSQDSESRKKYVNNNNEESQDHPLEDKPRKKSRSGQGSELSERKNSDSHTRIREGKTSSKEKLIASEQLSVLEPISLRKSSRGDRDDDPRMSPSLMRRVSEKQSPRLSRKGSKEYVDTSPNRDRIRRASSSTSLSGSLSPSRRRSLPIEEPIKNTNSSSDEEDEEILETDVKEAIYYAQTQFFYEMEPHLVYYSLLLHLMNLESCNYGYMGELVYKTHKVYIKVHSVLDKNDDESKHGSKCNQKLSQFNTLTGLAVTTKQVVVSNIASNDQRGEPGAPKGHPRIENMVAIPLMSGAKETVLAVIVVCNRPKGFDVRRHVLTIQPYLKTCGNLIEAYNNHQTIQRQNEKSLQKNRKRSVSFDGPTSSSGTTSISVPPTSAEEPVSPQSVPGSESSPSVRKTREIRSSSTEKRPRSSSISFWLHENLAILSPLRKKSATVAVPPSASISPPSSPGNRKSPRGSPPIAQRYPTTSFLDIQFGKRRGDFTPPKNKSPYDLLKEAIEQKDAKLLKKRLKVKKCMEHLNDVETANGKTLLYHAINKDEIDCVEALLEAGIDVNTHDSKGYTPLHLACELGNSRIITSLLQHPNIDTNALNNTGSTPFHYFCGHFSTPSSLRKIFDLFLGRKTDLNGQEKANGETPLHKAILNSSIRLLIVRLLLDHGVDVNASNIKGDTALHYAVRMNRKDLVLELLGAGADINRKNKQDKTPFDVAIEDGASEQITKKLSSTNDLVAWFARIGMEQYAPLFIREGIFKDVLHLVDEKVLTDMSITKTGDRIRILAACNELKQKKLELETNNNTPRGERALGSRRQRPIRPTQRSAILLPSLPSEQDLSFNISEVTSTEGGNWIPYSKIEFTKQLGGGASGQVYKGFYKDREVAIKVLETKVQDFEHEFKIMSSLGHHINIVGFYGACIEPRVCLVMELCARGSLYDVLNDVNTDIGWKETLGFATQMVRGLQVLHNANPQILHRDLKSMNFLVDKNWVVKVCDFGSARFLNSSNMSTFHKLRGTMIYCSPEVCRAEQYTIKSDIYSLAICFWEMVNRCIKGKYEKPYADNNFESSIQIVVLTPKGLRPKMPQNCPPIITQLLQDCWDNDGSKRPNCEELLFRLEECKRDLDENPQVWMQCEFRRPSIDSPTPSFKESSSPNF